MPAHQWVRPMRKPATTPFVRTITQSKQLPGNTSQSISSVRYPNQMDFLNAILVIVDRFSPKWSSCITTTTELTSVKTAEIYRDYVWSKAWASQKGHQWSRYTVHCTVHVGPSQTHQHTSKSIHHISPSNRRSNGTIESRNWAIPSFIHQSSSEQLAELAHLHRILIQRQSTHLYWLLSFLRQLWSSPEQGHQYQKGG